METIGQWERTSAFQSEQYLKAHGGNWGECRFQRENAELREQLAFVMGEESAHDLIEKLKGNSNG